MGLMRLLPRPNERPEPDEPENLDPEESVAVEPIVAAVLDGRNDSSAQEARTACA